MKLRLFAVAILLGCLTAVFAVDAPPAAPPAPAPALKLQTHYRRPGIRAHVTNASYTPPQVASRYDFPNDVTGKGVTVGIIELGGAFNATDLRQFMAGLGLSMPAVTVVSVDGAKPTSDGANGADGEVMLDVEIIASVAPGAAQRAYFAPNTTAGFLDAFKQARADGCTVVSCSWGAPEDQYSAAEIAAFNSEFQAGAAAGINYFVAAGDNGSGDGESGLHVDFPGSSPWVICCGGTSLPTTGPETVWNDGANGGATGGGVSTVFARPTWQPSTNANRQVPDVAGDADPNTGYTIQVDGSVGTIGGTSAVAPLFAAATALFTEKAGKPIGFLAPMIYGAANPYAGPFVDITSGTNGQYRASAGYDLCTGIGRPDGAKLFAALIGGTTPPPVVPPNPPGPPPVTPPGPSKLFSFTLAQPIGVGQTFRIRNGTGVTIPAGRYDVYPAAGAHGVEAVAE